MALLDGCTAGALADSETVTCSEAPLVTLQLLGGVHAAVTVSVHEQVPDGVVLRTVVVGLAGK